MIILNVNDNVLFKESEMKIGSYIEFHRFYNKVVSSLKSKSDYYKYSIMTTLYVIAEQKNDQHTLLLTYSSHHNIKFKQTGRLLRITFTVVMKNKRMIISDFT
ncbi:unnamed protein product [Rhizophagus irregularis]|nr:unnamed protein product [Rhizophagus irregularis]